MMLLLQVQGWGQVAGYSFDWVKSLVVPLRIIPTTSTFLTPRLPVKLRLHGRSTRPGAIRAPGGSGC